MTCSVPGCTRPKGTAKGLCTLHYRRLLRDGTPGEAGARILPRGGREAVKVSTSPEVARAMGEAAKRDGVSISEAWTRAAMKSLVRK